MKCKCCNSTNDLIQKQTDKNAYYGCDKCPYKYYYRFDGDYVRFEEFFVDKYRLRVEQYITDVDIISDDKDDFIYPFAPLKSRIKFNITLKELENLLNAKIEMRFRCKRCDTKLVSYPYFAYDGRDCENCGYIRWKERSDGHTFPVGDYMVFIARGQSHILHHKTKKITKVPYILPFDLTQDRIEKISVLV